MSAGKDGKTERGIDMEKLIQKLGLFKGRHDLPVEDFIFEETVDPTDLTSINEIAEEKLSFLKDTIHVSYNVSSYYADVTDVLYYGNSAEVILYVTGLTVALVEVLKVLKKYKVHEVTLMHFDINSGHYFPQVMELF